MAPPISHDESEPIPEHIRLYIAQEISKFQSEAEYRFTKFRDEITDGIPAQSASQSLKQEVESKSVEAHIKTYITTEFIKSQAALEDKFLKLRQDLQDHITEETKAAAGKLLGRIQNWERDSGQVLQEMKDWQQKNKEASSIMHDRWMQQMRDCCQDQLNAIQDHGAQQVVDKMGDSLRSIADNWIWPEKERFRHAAREMEHMVKDADEEIRVALQIAHRDLATISRHAKNPNICHELQIEVHQLRRDIRDLQGNSIYIATSPERETEEPQQEARMTTQYPYLALRDPDYQVNTYRSPSVQSRRPSATNLSLTPTTNSHKAPSEQKQKQKQRIKPSSGTASVTNPSTTSRRAEAAKRQPRPDAETDQWIIAGRDQHGEHPRSEVTQQPVPGHPGSPTNEHDAQQHAQHDNEGEAQLPIVLSPFLADDSDLYADR